jgi:hypothetical protein
MFDVEERLDSVERDVEDRLHSLQQDVERIAEVRDELGDVREQRE